MAKPLPFLTIDCALGTLQSFLRWVRVFKFFSDMLKAASFDFGYFFVHRETDICLFTYCLSSAQNHLPRTYSSRNHCFRGKCYKTEEADRLFRTRLVHSTDLATLLKLGNHVYGGRNYLTSASKEGSLMSKRAKEQVSLVVIYCNKFNLLSCSRLFFPYRPHGLKVYSFVGDRTGVLHVGPNQIVIGQFADHELFEVNVFVYKDGHFHLPPTFTCYGIDITTR